MVVSDALALGLTSFHYPIYTSWYGKEHVTIDSIDNTTNSVTNSNSTFTGQNPEIPGNVPVPERLTKEWIVNQLSTVHCFQELITSVVTQLP